MRQGDLPHLGAVHAGGVHGGDAGGRQAVVKTFCQRAGIAVAGFVRMLAGFVARHQFQRAQGQAGRVRLQPRQAVEHELAARGFGAQGVELIGASHRQGAQRREQRAHRFANAGGRLGQQAAVVRVGAVDGLGQFALAGAEVAKRKRQLPQRGVAALSVVGFLLGPVQETFAQGLEGGAQIGRAVGLKQHRFGVFVEVEIDQGDLDLLPALLFTQQPAVGAGLRPVQGAVVLGHALHRASVGFHFLHPPCVGVHAVGTPAHQQVAPAAAQAKDLSVNYVDTQRYLAKRDDRRREMVECEEAAFELLVTDKQFAKAVEPAMAYLNNPAPGLLLWVASLDFRLFSATDHVRDVTVALDGAQMLRATVTRVGTQMFVSPFGWVLAFDDDGAEHRIKPLAVVDVGPAHDERQRDATAVHQQMALASLFSPGPSGSVRRLLVPRAPSSLHHRRFAIATRCLACRHIPPTRLSRPLQRNPPSPIRESVCGWHWRCQSVLQAVPSTGNLCAAQTRWPQTPGVPALLADRRQACERTPCPAPACVAGPAAPRAAKTHPLQPRNQLVCSTHHSDAALVAARIDILSIYG